MDGVVLNLVPLLRLRRLLNLALAPVYPRPEFREVLGRQLMADATHMGAGSTSGWVFPGSPSMRREIIIGAALGSAFSLACLIALLIHSRSGRRLPADVS